MDYCINAVLAVYYNCRKDPSPEISSGPVVVAELLEFDGEKEL